jgi:uncharacterized protein
MKIERKVFDCAEFKAVDPEQGIAEMIVSVFLNEDMGGDIVMPGFFAQSLETRRTADGRPRVKGVWAHDWTTPVAKTLEARELLPGDPLLPTRLSGNGGLYIKGQFNLDTQRGREAFSDLKFGSIDEFSIGAMVIEQSWDNEKGIRRLIRGDFLEWSPVLLGMNDQTMLLSTKGYVENAEALEREVLAFVERTARRRDFRATAKEGRVLSQANREKLKSIRDGLGAVIPQLDEILTATEPAPKEDAGKALRLRARAIEMAFALR